MGVKWNDKLEWNEQKNQWQRVLGRYRAPSGKAHIPAANITRMLRFIRLLPFIPIVAFALGCGESAGDGESAVGGSAYTVDGSSDEAYDNSIVAMAEGLSGDKKDDLAQALMVLAIDSGAMRNGNSERSTAALREMLDGKTADEIIAMAEQARGRQ